MLCFKRATMWVNVINSYDMFESAFYGSAYGHLSWHLTKMPSLTLQSDV